LIHGSLASRREWGRDALFIFSRRENVLILQADLNEPIDITLPDGTKCEVSIVLIKSKFTGKLGFKFPDNIVIDRRSVSEAKRREGVKK
jgi:hypothetical protein